MVRCTEVPAPYLTQHPERKDETEDGYGYSHSSSQVWYLPCSDPIRGIRCERPFSTCPSAIHDHRFGYSGEGTARTEQGALRRCSLFPEPNGDALIHASLVLQPLLSRLSCCCSAPPGRGSTKLADAPGMVPQQSRSAVECWEGKWRARNHHVFVSPFPALLRYCEVKDGRCLARTAHSPLCSSIKTPWQGDRRQETGTPHISEDCLDAWGCCHYVIFQKNTPATSCSNEWSIVHPSLQRAMHPTTDERTTRARIVAGEREGREGVAKAGAVAASSQPWTADACESHRPSSCMFIDRTTCPRRQDSRHHETEHRE